MGALDDRANIHAELDGLQEHEIRALINAGIWRDEKRKIAEQYLDEKAAARAKAAREAAVSAAGQQCARLSKQLLILSSATNIGSNADQGVVDVTFRCLAAGDPELRKAGRSGN